MAAGNSGLQQPDGGTMNGGTGHETQGIFSTHNPDGIQRINKKENSKGEP